jgi:hypothetical protein
VEDIPRDARAQRRSGSCYLAVADGSVHQEHHCSAAANETSFVRLVGRFHWGCVDFTPRPAFAEVYPNEQVAEQMRVYTKVIRSKINLVNEEKDQKHLRIEIGQAKVGQSSC